MLQRREHGALSSSLSIESILTIDFICELNAKVLGIDTATFRKFSAGPAQINHTYIEPKFIEPHLTNQFKQAIDGLKPQNLPTDSMQRVSRIVRVAAPLFVNFLEIHPFSNGNGRVARLILTAVLSLVSPIYISVFDVYMYTSLEVGRQKYLEALVNDRNAGRQESSTICDMILTSLFSKSCLALDVLG